MAIIKESIHIPCTLVPKLQSAKSKGFFGNVSEAIPSLSYNQSPGFICVLHTVLSKLDEFGCLKYNENNQLKHTSLAARA